MTAPTCVRCTAPLTDQAAICQACTGRLISDLAATPDLLAELDTTITRQARITTPSKGNGDKPIPYHGPASLAAGQIRAVLYGWAKTLLEETDADALDYARADRAPAHWLMTHASDIRMRDWAPDLADELDLASRDGWACIDRPEERYYAGPCGNEIPLDDGIVQCGRVLWVKLANSSVRCPACLHVWDALERRDWLLRAAEDVLETARVIASALTVMRRRRVSPSTIRSWASEGVVEAMGERDGAKLYRVGDVIAAMDRPHIPRGAAVRVESSSEHAA